MITVADMVRTERAFLDELGIERLAAVAGGSLGGMQAFEWAILLSRSGRCDRRDRQHARAAAAGRRVERDRAQRDHGRPGLAGRPLLRHRAQARRRHGHRADGRPHHVSVGEVARRQVRPAAAVRRRHPLHADASRSSRSRTTCAIRPTSFVKRFDANTYLYTSRALTYFDLARQYGNGSARRGAARRVARARC